MTGAHAQKPVKKATQQKQYIPTYIDRQKVTCRETNLFWVNQWQRMKMNSSGQKEIWYI